MELSFRDPKFLKMVLDSFGPNLKKIVFKRMDCNVDLAVLAPICTKLEHLSFHDDPARIIMDFAAASQWNPDTFLPKLTHFQIRHSRWFDHNCLGHWAVLIEKKSTLVHLSLDCCHIGTNVILFKYLKILICGTYIEKLNLLFLFLNNIIGTQSSLRVEPIASTVAPN